MAPWHSRVAVAKQQPAAGSWGKQPPTRRAVLTSNAVMFSSMRYAAPDGTGATLVRLLLAGGGSCAALTTSDRTWAATDHGAKSHGAKSLAQNMGMSRGRGRMQWARATCRCSRLAGRLGQGRGPQLLGLLSRRSHVADLELGPYSPGTLQQDWNTVNSRVPKERGARARKLLAARLPPPPAGSSSGGAVPPARSLPLLAPAHAAAPLLRDKTGKGPRGQGLSRGRWRLISRRSRQEEVAATAS